MCTRTHRTFTMEFKVVLCLLFIVVAVYGEDKEEKVNAAVS